MSSQSTVLAFGGTVVTPQFTPQSSPFTLNITGLTGNKASTSVNLLRSIDNGVTFAPLVQPGATSPTLYTNDISLDIYELRTAATPAPIYTAQLNGSTYSSAVTVQFAS